MTLQQIRYILGVAENASLNKASEKLFISQPALSASIHDAEGELGFPIFTRNTRGVKLTEKGEDFIKDARSLYRNYEALLEKYCGKVKKTFSVATLYYAFARKAFVEVVKKFSAEGYDFAFREMKAEDIIEDVHNQKSQLGLLYMSEANRTQILKLLEVRQLVFHHLTECNAFVYLHKNHPLSQKESISLDELSAYQFVTFDTDDVKSFFSEEVLNRHELNKPIMVADRATELNLLKNLNGYTFLSGILGEEGDGDFITIPLKNLDEKANCSFELGYITKKDARMSNISLTYIDDVRRILHIAGFSC